MTYGAFILGLILFMAVCGTTFLVLFFKDGLPGKQLPLPPGVRALFAIALVGSPLASLLYASIALYRIFTQTWTYPTEPSVQFQQAALVMVVLLPTLAKLVTLLYIRRRAR